MQAIDDIDDDQAVREGVAALKEADAFFAAHGKYPIWFVLWKRDTAKAALESLLSWNAPAELIQSSTARVQRLNDELNIDRADEYRAYLAALSERPSQLEKLIAELQN